MILSSSNGIVGLVRQQATVVSRHPEVPNHSVFGEQTGSSTEGGYARCGRHGVSSRGAGMEVRQIVRTVRANWVVALVTFLVCLLIGAAYAVVPAKLYEATVVLLAQPPASRRRPGSDVGAIQIEIPQIAVEAENPSVDAEATAQVPERFRSVPVTITATGRPRLQHRHDQCQEHGPGRRPGVRQRHGGAGAACHEPRRGSLLVLSELGAAELPTAPTNPRATVALASVVFGLIAAVFAALAAGALRRFVAADEISERLGIPVLGEVPALARLPCESGPHVPIGGRRARPRGVPAAQKPPARHVPRDPPGDRLHVL